MFTVLSNGVTVSVLVATSVAGFVAVSLWVAPARSWVWAVRQPSCPGSSQHGRASASTAGKKTTS